MKLTNEQEAEIWQVYDTWLTAYLNADVKTYNSYLDDDYHFIGSTNNEEFLKRNDATTFFERTGDQFAGIMDLRNERKILEVFDTSIFITHFCDVWFINDEDRTYYGRFRLSSVMQKKNEDWRFIYQHFSMPDSKSDEGDSIGFDKVNAENTELKEAIKRRTIELESKNRELEVESALERVRSASMAMQGSDELASVARTVFEQLRVLGIDVYRSWIDIFHVNEGYVLTWSTDFEGNFQSNPATFPLDFDETMSDFYRDYKSPSKFIELEAHGDEVREWFDYLYSVSSDPIFKMPSVPDDLYQIWAKHKYGTVATTKLSPITNDEKDILNRFASVFEQAFTRFLDLQKAEAQAREAQIEMALEKVRSRTMAMQHSDELIETSELMFEQIKNLEIELWSCGFSLWYDDDSYFIGYNPGPEGKMGKPLRIPLTEDVFFTTIREAKRRGEEFLVFESEGKSLEQTYHYMDALPVVGETMRGFVEAGYPLPTYQVTHCGFFSEGHLMFITQEPNPEAIDIFKRFTKVFEQTYTRFLDLQKAEAQAREAQIEVAVERVRAKALAMHKSTEILQVAITLKEQMEGLNLSGVTAATIYLEHDDNKIRVWDITELKESENGPQLSSDFTFRLEDTDPDLWVRRVWNAREKYSVIEMSGNDFIKCEKWIREFDETTADNYREFIRAANIEHTWHPTVQLEKGKLNLDFTVQPPLEMEFILPKMGAAFDLAYRRFLDLQKAEQQARESEIQLALERVRSKSMAMHQSDELADLSLELVKQVHALGIDTWFCAFNIYDDHPEGSIEWGSNGQGTFPRYRTPREGVFLDYYEAGQRGETLLINEIGEDECPAHYDYLCSLPGVGEQLLKIKDEGIPFPAYQIDHAAFFRYGYILFITFEPVPEAHDIFIRFAKVFQQTYTRFLDLQKSEEQAREAKIEAALERVRARSMGMHKSDDLIDVVREIGKGIHELGIQLHYSQIYTDYTYDPKTGLNIWVDVEGRDYLEKFHLPYIDHSITLNHSTALNEGLDYFSDRYSKAEKDSYFKLLFKYSDLKRIPKKRKELILNASGWTRFTVILNEATLNFGRYSLDEFTDEEHEIFIRFSKVFGQAYTRFLDLQKAEEQVREAEIQLALERVRAKTMAMKTQPDLFGVVELFGDQLKAVGVRFDNVSIIEGPITKTRDWDLWSHIPEADNFTGKVHTPYIDTPYFTKTAKAVEEYERTGNPIQVKSFTKSEKDEFLDHYFKHAPATPDHVLDLVYKNPGSVIVDAFLKEVTVSLVRWDLEPYTDEDLEIFERFAKEFRRAYIRYLDIQKAEMQAREAEIEASLERVRSRSLAMHKPDELQDVVRVVAEELKNTGVILDTGGAVICTYFQDSKDVIHWTATDDPAHPSVPYLLPYFEDELFDEAWESKSRGDDYFAKVFSYDVKNAFFSHAFEHSDYRQLPDEYKKIILESKNHGLAWAWAENSAIMIPSIQGDLPSEEEKKTLIRFAKVFEQSFIRFLDLQKAEKQAREAEIEAALERVRSRSMGMQKSSDLRSVVDTLYGEFKRLGLIFDNVVIQLLLDDTKDFHMWITSEDGLYEDIIHWPYVDLPVFHEFYEARIGNKSINYRTSSEAETIEFFEEYFKLDAAPQERKSATKQVKSINNMGTYQEHTGIFLMRYTEGEYSEKDQEIVRRFSKVFEQTYTRFLDLKKAEKQARESRIEAALERVRSRAMAMQTSDELKDVALELRTQMGLLGQKDLEVCAIHLYDLHQDHFESWGAMHPPDSDDEILQSMALFPKSGSLIIEEMMDNYASGQTDYVLVNEGEKFKQWFELMKEHAPEIYRHLSKAKADTPADKLKAFWAMSEFSGGALIMVTYSYPDEDSRNLLRRTANAFGLAYKRFNDLKRAEEQAREAQIENALEKVRSRSLAMQTPDELVEVAQLLREEMGALGVEEVETSSIYIHDDTGGLTQCWFNIKDSDNPGKSVTDQMTIDLQDTWVGRQMNQFYDSGQDSTSILMKGDQRIEWIRYSEEKSDLFGKSEFYGESIPERTYHLYKFSNGFLGAASPGEISDESWDLMRRATGVFSFAYTRFSDLQKAEESARRALQQASLDRVRADISSMRSADDLDRVTPLIWSELTTLGIPFIRCGVFIIQEETEVIEAYLSKPDGTSLAAMHLPFNSSELAKQTVNAWQKGIVFKQHWSREEFINWGRSLMEQGQVSDLESYQGAEEAPESLHLHFIPFNQGMLYVGSTDSLNGEEINLAQSLAKAFSIAYARYEDFVKLEKAKAGIEDALTELKATQSQLIQQEKLASLGQLTAGIAHEIKNPLNFVNNFSELSVELIEEARDEVNLLRQGFGGQGREVKGVPSEASAKVGEKAKGKSEKETPLLRGDGVADGNIRGVSGEDERPEIGDVSNNDSDPNLILDILDDIEANLKTIHKHGSRADSIVKSMLQHSRGGDGKMEPTPLNPLIKEYVNLAFHGMRAGNDPINVDIDLQLDDEVGEVPLVAEDFSRVILNLVNNAFDAMGEKQGAGYKVQGAGGPGNEKNSPRQPAESAEAERRRGVSSFQGSGHKGQGAGGYEPKLTVRTKLDSGKVTIEIEDNGPGIPGDIKDKILQPFFTTKKGTAGTGLGLSITNDIVKAHGGKLDLESVEGKKTLFVMTIPK